MQSFEKDNCNENQRKVDYKTIQDLRTYPQAKNCFISKASTDFIINFKSFPKSYICLDYDPDKSSYS